MTDVVGCPTCGGSGVVAAPSSVPAEDEVLSDRDQTANDADQTWSDHDQTASERDQRSSDEDQAASDVDFASGGDSATHARSSLAREHATHDRSDVARMRDVTSASRFETAEDRDRSAELRDRVDEGHDRLAARMRSVDDYEDELAKDVLLQAERNRERAAADRAKAAVDRAKAAADRQEATNQRAKADVARAESLHNLELSATDELTGARARKFGLAELGREIERARRTGEKLTLAFIDVDGLKEVNDTLGHPAGDRVLHVVVETVKANVRPYDVVVRYGGDEFLCVMPNLPKNEAERRLKKIAAKLKVANDGHSITFGLAEYELTDGLEEFILHADEDLLKARLVRENQE